MHWALCRGTRVCSLFQVRQTLGQFSGLAPAYEVRQFQPDTPPSTVFAEPLPATSSSSLRCILEPTPLVVKKMAMMCLKLQVNADRRGGPALKRGGQHSEKTPEKGEGWTAGH